MTKCEICDAKLVWRMFDVPGTHDLVDTVPGYTGGLEPDVR